MTLMMTGPKMGVKSQPKIDLLKTLIFSNKK